MNEGAPITVAVPMTLRDWHHLQAMALGSGSADGVEVLQNMVELVVEGLANPGSYAARWVRATLQADCTFPVETHPDAPQLHEPTQAVKAIPLPLAVQPGAELEAHELTPTERQLLERLERHGPTAMGKLSDELREAAHRLFRKDLISRTGYHLRISGRGRRLIGHKPTA